MDTTTYDVGARLIEYYRYGSPDVYHLTGMTLRDTSNSGLNADRSKLTRHLYSLVDQLEKITPFRVLVIAITWGAGDFSDYYQVQMNVRGQADSAIHVRNQVNDAVALDFGPFFVENGFRSAVNLPADPGGDHAPGDGIEPTGYQRFIQGNPELAKESEAATKHTKEVSARADARYAAQYAAEAPQREREAKRRAIANAKEFGPSWLRWVPDPIYAWGQKHPLIVVLLGLGIIIEVLVDIIAKL